VQARVSARFLTENDSPVVTLATGVKSSDLYRRMKRDFESREL
jgi:hypothetical protein